MSIHTILSQMEEEADKLLELDESGIHVKPFMNYNNGYHEKNGWDKEVSLEEMNPDFGCTHDDGYLCEHRAHVIKQFFRSFASRIVEEVQKEERERIKKALVVYKCPITDDKKSYVSVKDIFKTIDSGTKLQKMKEI